MRTKYFITTLLLFVGLITNAQKNKNSSGSNTQQKENSKGSENTQSSSSFLDSDDKYTGNTKLINVTTNVYFFNSDSENMGVILTNKGVVLVDIQAEEEITRSLKIVNRLNKKLSIKYLITSSNLLKNKKTTSELRTEGALFLAQDFSSKSKTDRKGSNLPKFKPDIAFTDQMALNFEGEKIDVISLNNTGNSAVYLTKKNVLFTGSVYAYNKYPEINVEQGKSFNEISKALSVLQNITNKNTKIVPGQGDLARQIDLVNTNKMMKSIYKQVYSHRVNGKTLEQTLAMNICRNYDTQGYGNGTITTKMFITSIYNEVAKELGPLDTRTPEEKAMDRLKEMQKEKKQKESKN
jgi:cyclase